MQEKDFEWFLENYSDLHDRYGDSFLVVKGERVIGVYESFFDAVEATQKTEELGTFIVQECNGEESAYTAHIASMNFR